MKKKVDIINHLIPAIVFLMIAFVLILLLVFSTGEWKGSQAGLQLSALSFTLISIFNLGFAVYDLHKQKQAGEAKTEVSGRSAAVEPEAGECEKAPCERET